jgi:hypothetical protein
MITQVDLETVNPVGRADVLLYRGAELLAKHIEASYNLQGIWDNCKPHVNKVIVEGMKGWEVPTELKVILGIVQSNWKRQEGIE